jgi:hypothetical protein
MLPIGFFIGFDTVVDNDGRLLLFLFCLILPIVIIKNKTRTTQKIIIRKLLLRLSDILDTFLDKIFD